MAAAATMVPGILFAADQKHHDLTGDIKWSKAPCRFCGVGCGILVGTQAGKAVAVKGDPDCSVNKGLLCVKGYHQILCTAASELDLVAAKMQKTIEEYGKDAVAMYTSGQSTIPEGYVASKFMKGAIGTNNLECNARLCMASAVAGFLTTFGADEPMGCYEDIDHANVFVLWGNNMAEMHPVLFSRMLDNRLRLTWPPVLLAPAKQQTSRFCLNRRATWLLPMQFVMRLLRTIGCTGTLLKIMLPFSREQRAWGMGWKINLPLMTNPSK